MIFDLSNPSDPYTLESDDFEVACIAACLVGGGHYGISEIGGEKGMPIFIFGGHDEWFVSTFGQTFKESLESISQNRRESLAECLESFLCGTPGDRNAYKKGLELIEGDERRKLWRDFWHDQRRGSMNDIGGLAWRWAEKVRENKMPGAQNAG
ncbi:MAG: hypothetical protein ABFD81_18110 [Syntrophaceae bacterium]